MRELADTSIDFSSSVGPEPKRMPWVDAAKGLSIVLVILMHSAAWYEDKLLGNSLVYDVSRLLQPLRMPLFFLISGMLISNAITRNRRKIAVRALSLFSVYALWTIVHASRLAVFPHLSDQVQFSLALLGWSLLVPGIYWYIWALPLYYVVTSLLIQAFGEKRKLLAIYVGLLAAAILCFFWQEISGFVTVKADLHRRAEYNFLAAATRSFFWFMLGAAFSNRIKQTVNDMPESGYLVVVMSVAMLGVGMVIAAVDSRLEHLVAPFAMVSAVLILLRRFNRLPIMKVFQIIGRRTLPIYIFHFLLLNVFSFLLGKAHLAGPYPLVIGVMAPVVMATGMIALCLAMETSIRRVGMGIVLDGFPGLHRPARQPGSTTVDAKITV